jgi:hypothetical protein
MRLTPSYISGACAEERASPARSSLFATGMDASVACLGGVAQATWWLPVDVARRLHVELGDKLHTGRAEDQTSTTVDMPEGGKS